MKRKFIKGFISSAVALCLALSCAACDISEIHFHDWDEGVITTQPTCITPGVITYTCLDCGAVKKEPIDADGVSHLYRYEYDDTYHWGVCAICGDVLEKHEHDFGETVNEEEKICVDCGYTVPLSSYAYEVVFLAEHATVIVYKTQDYSEEGTESSVAYSRESDTGTLTKSGEGQVNFLLVPELGYEIESIEIAGGGYKNLKDSADTGVENLYRITKITSDLTVTVTMKISALDLPVIEIDTENGAEITSKEVYLSATVSVSNAEETYCFEAASAQIRGRGNTSWEMPKKSYRLKFSKKTDLFGNGSAKNWTLIANYGDQSLLRNYIAYAIGSGLEGLSATTTTTQLVELFINGEYLGVYLVCEQNEVGVNRVNVSESLDSYDTGYLIEMDTKASEGDVVFTIDGSPYSLKSPDADDVLAAGQDIENYVAFISDYLQRSLNALQSGTWEEVTELIDVESFSDSYIVNELFKTIDVAETSFFLYKDAGGKLSSGPIWDYDVSSGNCSYAPTDDYVHTLYALRNVWYSGLMQHEEFRSLVSQKLREYSDTIVSTIDECISEVSGYARSIDRNFARWDILGKLVWPNTEEIAAIDSWEGHAEYLRSWLLESLDYMLEIYCGE